MFRKIRPHLNRRNLIMVSAVAFILYAGLSTLRVMARNYELQQDVDHLQNEIELLKLQTRELEYRVAYYRTDAFVEKEARDKLGLQAPGEQVVVFPDKVPRGVNDGVPDAAPRTAVNAALSNFEQWMYFLFKREPN